METTIYTDTNGRALQGYDAVAYFTVGEPKQGDPEISSEWSGATWLFATTEHREMFEADPKKYAPAFGGHCALGSMLGANLPGSPKRWRIENDRLYINKNLFAAMQFPLFARRIRRLADEGSQR